MANSMHYDPALNPFDPTARGLHPNNALWLAAAGNLAYESEKVIQKTTREWGFDRCQFLHVSTEMGTGGSVFPVDTQAFVCTGNRATLIAFRGTEPLNVKDWFTDLMIGAVFAPAGLGKVHQGFDTAYRVIQSPLRQLLSDWKADDNPIWIAGHSLGGALAVLAAVDLTLNRKLPVQGVYTFGQPRVGDRTFARSVKRTLGDRLVRFVNNQDVVPQVPTPGMLLSYWHPVPETRFDRDGNLVEKPGWRTRLGLEKGRVKTPLPKLGIEAFTDHSMDRYIERVRRLGEGKPG